MTTHKEEIDRLRSENESLREELSCKDDALRETGVTTFPADPPYPSYQEIFKAHAKLREAAGEFLEVAIVLSDDTLEANKRREEHYGWPRTRWLLIAEKSNALREALKEDA